MFVFIMSTPASSLWLLQRSAWRCCHGTSHLRSLTFYCCSRAENLPLYPAQRSACRCPDGTSPRGALNQDFYGANNRIGYACQRLAVQMLENKRSKARYGNSRALARVTPFGRWCQGSDICDDVFPFTAEWMEIYHYVQTR